MTAHRILLVMRRIERIGCVLSFATIAVSLIADVGSRLIQGSGILGAPQIGVIGMIGVGMFGIGLASDAGGHLRPRFLDTLWPDKWLPAILRIADAVTALFFLAFGVIAVLVVEESRGLGDVTSVLRWPIWPLQSVIAAAFLLNALRHVLFAARPDLRPSGISPRGAEAAEDTG